MGQQQLLLIILGVIIVGIAIAVGLQLFQSGSIGANQDAIVNDVMNISAHADQWRIRPTSMGGGGGSFGDGDGGGYQLPQRLDETGNGTYTAQGDGMVLTVVGTSTIHNGTVTLTYNASEDDDDLKYTWVFTDDFE